MSFGFLVLSCLSLGEFRMKKYGDDNKIRRFGNMDVGKEVMSGNQLYRL